MEFEKAKVVVGGDSGVGKTALVHLICNQQTLLHPSYTIGCSVDIKIHLCKNDPTKEHPYFIELWDIGGSNSHANTRSIFYQNLHGLILVYDCTNSKSQLNLRKWLCDVLGRQAMKKPEPDVGVIGATTAAGSVSGAAGLGNGGVKINMTNQMTSLLPMRNTENVTDEIYPPVLVIGTKLDLLGPRSLRSLRRVNSRFNPISSYISNHYDNELSADNYPGVMMTPRSCISSVQFFEDTPSSSSASWNSLYHQNVYRNNNSQSSISSLPLSQPLLPPPTQRHQSVYVDLSDSQLSSLSSGDNKVWNFAAEQGFSEILLSCNSVASISPGSPQNVLLDRFFDEVINYKMFSMSMNCNLSPDVCRVKRRQVDSRDTSSSLFNSYKCN